jgi:hypothetical protein
LALAAAVAAAGWPLLHIRLAAQAVHRATSQAAPQEQQAAPSTAQRGHPASALDRVQAAAVALVMQRLRAMVATAEHRAAAGLVVERHRAGEPQAQAAPVPVARYGYLSSHPCPTQAAEV